MSTGQGSGIVKDGVFDNEYSIEGKRTLIYISKLIKVWWQQRVI